MMNFKKYLENTEIPNIQCGIARGKELTEELHPTPYGYMGPRDKEPTGDPVLTGIYADPETDGYYHPRADGSRLPLKNLDSAEMYHKSLKSVYKNDLTRIGQTLKPHYEVDNPTKNAIDYYVVGSTIINKTLHNGKHLGTKPSSVTTSLDAAMEKHLAPEDLVVYSGTSDEHAKTLRKGGVIHHPAFLSSSLSAMAAASFAEAQKGDILQIHIPKGHKGLYVGHISHIPGEHEFIIPRNTTLKIHKDKEKVMHTAAGKYIVHHATIEPKND